VAPMSNRTTATAGVIEACLKGGGWTMAITAPTAPASPSTTWARDESRRTRLPSDHANTTATAAVAASIDQRRSSAQAPANPEPVANLVHGNNVAAAAAPNAAPASNSTVGRRGFFGAGSGGASSPSALRRHSGPSTRPRTGTAQRTQRRRSHSAQWATATRLGCTSHRSATFVPRSSEGMARA
jgi:hypothetical protein